MLFIRFGNQRGKNTKKLYSSVHLYILFKDKYYVIWYFCTLFSLLFIVKLVGKILKGNKIESSKYSIKYTTYNDVIKICDGKNLIFLLSFCQILDSVWSNECIGFT